MDDELGFNFGEASTKVSNPRTTKKKGGKFSRPSFRN
jgi:hypothetical protein